VAAPQICGLRRLDLFGFPWILSTEMNLFNGLRAKARRFFHHTPRLRAKAASRPRRCRNRLRFVWRPHEGIIPIFWFFRNKNQAICQGKVEMSPSLARLKCPPSGSDEGVEWGWITAWRSAPPHGAVASQAVIHAVAGASGWALPVSGDDGVETGVEGLVVFDRLRGRQGLEGRESEVAVLEAHAQGPIEEVEKRDFGSAQRHARPGRLDGLAGCAGAESERLGERALFAARQRLGEIGLGAGPRPMGVFGLPRGDREPFVPAFAESVGERLRLIDGRHASQAHLLISRSCRVWLARSTRPLACGVVA